MSDVIYLTGPQVRTRYGWSAMTLWRRDQDPKFPKPLVDGNRKLYRLDELEAWERSRRGVKIAAPGTRPRTPPPRRTKRDAMTAACPVILLGAVALYIAIPAAIAALF